MTGAFSRKTSGISWDLAAFQKIKELCANAVETPLGVIGLLAVGSVRNGHEVEIFFLILIVLLEF